MVDAEPKWSKCRPRHIPICRPNEGFSLTSRRVPFSMICPPQREVAFVRFIPFLSRRRVGHGRGATTGACRRGTATQDGLAFTRGLRLGPDRKAVVLW